MLAVSDSAEVLRNKIKEDVDMLEIDELKKLYQTLAAMAAEKAIKFADRDWEEKGLSREKIKEEVEKYRHSKDK
ncbi:MAG: hypothetical protein JSV88_07405 [Candidatus Aminicenantes bacterium]|nr:MAG: hypothetical protein JSV88_07405 [Candidatus Aminicenantes bacterium]